MTAPHCPGACRYFPLGPENIFALRNGPVCVNAAENRSATTDLSVVHDHKPSEIRDAIVVIYDESATGLDYKSANFVSLQLFASVALALECRRIHDSLD